MPHLADFSPSDGPGQNGVTAELVHVGDVGGGSSVEHQLAVATSGPIQCSASSSMLRIRADRS